MEVVTLGIRTSRGSVGVMGLTEVKVLTEDSELPDVTAVMGVRGSGLTIVHTEGESSSFSASLSASMASELRITRKWVLSEGVMVTFFSGSGFSFLVT